MVLQRMERHLHVSCSSDCDTATHLKDTDLWWLCSSLTQGYANRAASLCFQASGLIGRRGSSSCFGIGESPCQEHCDQFCVPQLRKTYCEYVQRRATKLVTRLEGMFCEKWLRTRSLSVLEKSGSRGDLIALCWFLWRGRGEGGADISSLWYSGIGHVRMIQGCSREVQTELKKQFFTEKVFKHQNSLLWEMVIALSLVSA